MLKRVTIWVYGHVSRLASIQRQTLKFMPESKKCTKWTLAQPPQCTPRTHAYHFHFTDQAGELRCTAQAAAFVYRRQAFSARMKGKLRRNRPQILRNFPRFSVQLQRHRRGLLCKDYLLMYILEPASCLTSSLFGIHVEHICENKTVLKLWSPGQFVGLSSVHLK